MGTTLSAACLSSGFLTPGLLATWNGSRRTICSSLMPVGPTSSESVQQRPNGSPSVSSEPQPRAHECPHSLLLRGWSGLLSDAQARKSQTRWRQRTQANHQGLLTSAGYNLKVQGSMATSGSLGLGCAFSETGGLVGHWEVPSEMCWQPVQ